jgi:hypothetical protein
MTKKQEYRLIPLDDIDKEAREIAVAWIENYKGPGMTIMPDIAQKQKLASDIINYANKRVLIRTEQYRNEITQLVTELEQLRERVKQLQKTT